jgi:hypothetical protein
MHYKPQPFIYKLHKNRDKVIELIPIEQKKKLPDKLYGNIIKNDAYRIWNKFVMSNHTIGAMLHGDKGTGKTLVCNILCNTAIDNDIPVIQITEIKLDLDIISYLNNLKDCVIFFDEFSKNVHYNIQHQMLTFFNPDDYRKKLFLLTDNYLRQINEFLINRPGRIHYLIDYKKLEEDALMEYLNDYDVNVNFKNELMVKYRSAISFGFDHLKAIIEEHVQYPNETLDEILRCLIVKFIADEKEYILDRVTDLTTGDLIDISNNPTYLIPIKRLDNGREFYYKIKDNETINFSNHNIVDFNNDKIVINVRNYELIFQMKSLKNTNFKPTNDSINPFI